MQKLEEMIQSSFEKNKESVKKVYSFQKKVEKKFKKLTQITFQMFSDLNSPT